MKSLTKTVMSVVAAAMIAISAGQATAPAQSQEERPRRASDTTSHKAEFEKAASEKDSKAQAATAALEQADPAEEAAIQNQISSVYDSFYNSYRLGPGDVLGIYVEKHPQDSVERTVVSPVGQVYYPLLGNVTVVGKTVPQIQAHLTAAVSEFIKDP
ncbi:MAG TPA: polysaccharide biosynthesis/export family protein, partial [Blastocatellia bacterium]|nr:polysaccharide biosynthesis/export family protein [Blastocatellia bacterium]